jgi:hypothetical protein
VAQDPATSGNYSRKYIHSCYPPFTVLFPVFLL